MRQHNGVILVTEPVLIKEFTLTSAETSLPDLPTGDLGKQILQITLRSTNAPWEWCFDATGGWFWMDTGDIIVLPIRDRVALEDFNFRAESADADMRIVYEA